MTAVSPTGSDIFKTLGDFLTGILPAGTEVIQAQVNRVPEPKVENFVVMTALRRDRLETNIDQYEDVAFTGSVAGTVLAVTNVAFGTLRIGARLFGEGVVANTKIISAGTGTGGVGTYNVSVSQTLTGRALAAGVEDIVQPTRLSLQLDVHGPLGGDNAQTISTLLRDAYGVTAMQAINSSIWPLFADDPKQLPFINEQKQIETRWVVETVLQVNETVSDLPQQFLDQIALGLINVDVTYPIGE